MKVPGKEQKNKKIKFRQNTLKTANSSNAWVVLITAVSFSATVILLSVSQRIFKSASVFLAVLAVLVIIMAGILFDMIGIAVTSADEAPFHAIASRKHRGAKQAIRLIRNADRVASFCNDVIGDICGVISGTASALIVFRISTTLPPVNTALFGGIISGMVAALTVGGKAAGKSFAIRNSNYIVYKVSVVLEMFKRTNVV